MPGEEKKPDAETEVQEEKAAENGKAEEKDTEVNEVTDNGEPEFEVPDPDKPEGIVETTSVDVKDCPVVSVVVYLDRAEVCRSIKRDVKRGDNEFILQKLSNAIDKDSIRVEGRGAATISEVTFVSHHIPSDREDTNATATDLEKKISEKRRERKVMTDTQARLRKQREVLDGVANNIMVVGETKDKDGKAVPMCSMLDAKMVDGIQGFFSMYETQAERLDNNLQQLEVDVEKLDKEIISMEKNLYKIKSVKDECLDRECSIIVDVKKDDDIELLFSYVVTKAKWSPKYDLRVFSKDKKMKLMYFGVIEQVTGEEWKDAKISLSTATPSIGGQVPSLGTYQLSLKPKASGEFMMNGIGSHNQSKLSKAWASGVGTLKRKRRPLSGGGGAPAGTVFMSPSVPDYMSPSPYMEKEDSFIGIEENFSQVKESISSTTFEIARKCTILSDSQGHRVSIGIIDLNPTFEHESVPKKGARAYLKAKVKNTSEYALLSGPANIFLDNNFVSKSELKSVSPDEEFTCSLGVDPAVKVTYHPIHKFRDQTGILTKFVSMNYQQLIEVKNTRADAIKVLVSEQLPQSTEEKIKVKLAEPNLKEEKKDTTGGKSVKLNKFNNIEWQTDIPAGETHTYTLKYTIDYPVNEDIESNVTPLEGETVV